MNNNFLLALLARQFVICSTLDISFALWCATRMSAAPARRVDALLRACSCMAGSL